MLADNNWSTTCFLRFLCFTVGFGCLVVFKEISFTGNDNDILENKSMLPYSPEVEDENDRPWQSVCDKSMTSRLVIIVVATLRYGSRTPGLVVKDAATARHWSRMPRWLGWSTVGERKFDGSDRNEKVQEPVAGSRQHEQVGHDRAQRWGVPPLLLQRCRSGLGEHGRRSREVDLCSRSLRGGGATTISGDVLTVEIEQSGREHRRRTPRLVIIVVATLRYGSRTPGLVVKDAATVRHRSRMPRWLEGASEREEPAATRLARDGRSKGDNGKQQQARKAVAAEEEPHVGLWVQRRSRPAVGERKLDGNDRNENVQEPTTGSRQQEQVRSGLDEHGRRLREVDLCSRSLRGGGAVAIGRDVLTVEIEQRGRE
ncbi:hypothetical protein B296_00036128 [Ensete ventricosum]|uniref:Uncharacterized protein n=1 Tax=Ensete ventricosum TaxID=4639 RepID=A0A426XLX7_ENSVE|nr:hypothetical protein B296_00036128 [Ensete ventricosum]